MIIKSMNNKFMFFPTGENDDSVDQKLTTKESRIVKTLMLIGMFGGVIWIIISDYLPFVPSGKVINETFLNTLKWMIAAKYSIAAAFLALVLVPIIVAGFKYESGRNKKFIITIIVVTIVILGIIVAPHLKGAYHGIVDTPSVSANLVSDKRHSVRGKTYTVYFEDGTYTHCSAYLYDLVEPGDEVYVVICDGEGIGVFKAADYELAVDS